MIPVTLLLPQNTLAYATRGGGSLFIVWGHSLSWCRSHSRCTHSVLISFFVNNKQIQEEEASAENCFYQIGLWVSLRGIFLVDDACGRIQLTMGGAIPGEMVLGALRKQAEQARSMTVSSTSPWAVLQFRPWGSFSDGLWPERVIRINPFLLKLLSEFSITDYRATSPLSQEEEMSGH